MVEAAIGCVLLGALTVCPALFTGSAEQPFQSALDKIRTDPTALLTKTWLMKLAPEELKSILVALELEPQPSKQSNAIAVVAEVTSDAKRVGDIEKCFSRCDKVRAQRCQPPCLSTSNACKLHAFFSVSRGGVEGRLQVQVEAIRAGATCERIPFTY